MIRSARVARYQNDPVSQVSQDVSKPIRQAGQQSDLVSK
jgi:hypothetical protein